MRRIEKAVQSPVPKGSAQCVEKARVIVDEYDRRWIKHRLTDKTAHSGPE
ncbi:hypothetical protein [Burkholderia stagnalis]